MRLPPVVVCLMLLIACASCGGGGSGGGGGTAGGTPTATNTAPRFTSAASVSIVENSALNYQATATDAEGNALTYSISGGADASKFAITPAGLLNFVTSPNFDLPTDADGDNVYLVQLQVSDGSLSSTLDLSVTVTNDREGVALHRIAHFTNPVVLLRDQQTNNAVFVGQRDGAVYRVILAPAPDNVQLLFRAGNISTAGEGGLLGLAGRSDTDHTFRLYAFVVAANGDIEIRQYYYGTPSRAPLTLLTIPHPGSTSNYGGWMEVATDHNLYVATGDGGGVSDPNNNAQNPNSRLGKILRIALDPNFGSLTPFSPAPGNPYLAGGGDPYVWAMGLRNPVRFAVDGDRLIIGDRGQNNLEEIDIAPLNQPGLNFGWPFFEGTQPVRGTPPPGLTAPVSQYLHGTGLRQGGAIVGGDIYHGHFPTYGTYIFGDYATGRIWTVPGTSLVQGSLLAASNYELRNLDFAPDAGTLTQPVGFASDLVGDFWILDAGGDLFVWVD